MVVVVPPQVAGEMPEPQSAPPIAAAVLLGGSAIAGIGVAVAGHAFNVYGNIRQSESPTIRSKRG
jgi:hypothetical protein